MRVGSPLRPVNLRRGELRHPAVTPSTLTVPCTLSGSYDDDSGVKVAGTHGGGTYQGVDSHGLRASLQQTNLDGSGAAHPVVEPEPQLLQVN